MGKTESAVLQSSMSRVARKVAARNVAYYAARSLRYDAREQRAMLSGSSNSELDAMRALDAYAMGRR